MASVLPSGANTFRSVSSWGLASPRSILVMNALDAGRRVLHRPSFRG